MKRPRLELSSAGGGEDVDPRSMTPGPVGGDAVPTRCVRRGGKYGVAVSVAGTLGVSLIRTKVHGPITRALVPRPALVERLVRGPARRLTLVRGQAGWGKSSVLAAWSAAD